MDRRVVTAAACLVLVMLGAEPVRGAEAPIVCAKKGRRTLVLRPEGCKPKEVPISVAGPEGAPGKDALVTDQLPEGVTLRGTFALSLDLDVSDPLTPVYDSISFGFGATVQARYVDPLNPVAECPGSAEFPSAAPGYLCVFEIYRHNLLMPFVCPSERPFLGDVQSDCPAADRFGAIVGGHPAGPGRITFAGSWAVTSAGF